MKHVPIYEVCSAGFRRGRARAGVAVLALVLAGLACAPIEPDATATEIPPAATLTATLAPTPTATVEPLTLPTPLPEPQTATPEAPWFSGEVRVFPGPVHYVGDVLSVEVAVQNMGRLPGDHPATLFLGDQQLSDNPFQAYSPLRDNVLVFRWAWDTTDYQPAQYRLSVQLAGSDEEPAQTLTFMVELRPADERPEQEQVAEWASRRTACCQINYLTVTAASRDIDTLAQQVDQSVSFVEDRLGLPVNGAVPITFIDNVWGNGAYTAGELVISYVDRSFNDINLDYVLRHEAVHWALRDVGGPPAILAEGAAVYFAGGHYGPDPIPQRAAALFALDAYVPLEDLANDFRSYQHEAAYIEAGALVQYLVDTYGQEAFLNLYGQDNINAGSDAGWLDVAMRRVYDTDLVQIERDYRAWLNSQDTGDQVDSLGLTIALHDSVRQYQALYDKYEESLPGADEARAAGRTYEFLREPTDPENVALEALYVTIYQLMGTGDYEQAHTLLDAINATLEDGNFTREPVATYLALAEAVHEQGYEAQKITVDGNTAQVVAIPLDNWPDLQTLTLTFDGSQWQISGG